MSTAAEIERFRWLLDTVRREAEHLLGTTHRLFQDDIDAGWVDALARSPELAERVDAFGARFGRLQDSIGHNHINLYGRERFAGDGDAWPPLVTAAADPDA